MVDMPFNMGGWRRTNRYRIRNGFWGAVVEQLIEYQDGSFRWQKAKMYETFGLDLKRD